MSSLPLRLALGLCLCLSSLPAWATLSNAQALNLAGQQRMLEILQFKLDILWSMLDAMSMAYELERPPYHTGTRDNVWHRGIAL